jgi:hypothetical protein
MKIMVEGAYSDSFNGFHKKVQLPWVQRNVLFRQFVHFK